MTFTEQQRQDVLKLLSIGVAEWHVCKNLELGGFDAFMQALSSDDMRSDVVAAKERYHATRISRGLQMHELDKEAVQS